MKLDSPGTCGKHHRISRRNKVKLPQAPVATTLPRKSTIITSNSNRTSSIILLE